MTNPDLHSAPSPEFVAGLQSRLVSEKRRLRTFPPEPARKRLALSTVMVLVLGALGLGAGGVVVAEQVETSRRTQLLVARAQIRVELLQQRLEHDEREYERVRARVDAGAVPIGELAAVEEERERGRLAFGLAASRLEEVRKTGREASDSLSAPMVGGMDYVHERLKLEIAMAGTRVGRAQDEFERVEIMAAEGLRPTTDLAAAEAELERARLEVARLENRLALRRRYVKGDLGAEQVELNGLRAEARARFESLMAGIEAQREELARLEALADAGVVPTSEPDGARISLSELQADLRLVTIELELLEGRLGR